MKHTFIDKNGVEKTINIDDAEVARSQKSLGISLEEAIDLYLCDHDFIVDEEQEALNKKAAGVKIDHDTGRKSGKGGRKPDKDKEQFLAKIYEVLAVCDLDLENLVIANKNNEIAFAYQSAEYSLKLVKHNKKKI